MRRRLALVAVGALLLAACGIPLDRSPQDVAGDPDAGLSNASEATGGTSGGAARIFFAATDAQTNTTRLQQVFRAVAATPGDVLAALFKGLTDAESRRLTTQIPVGTKLVSVSSAVDGLVIVDVDRTIFQAKPQQALVVAVAQIVYTATALANVDRVRLLVDGAAQAWPAGDGRQRDGDLTPLAYPSFYPVEQPELPPVPSPTGPTTLPPVTVAPGPTTSTAPGARVSIGPPTATTASVGAPPATAAAPPPEPTAPPTDGTDAGAGDTATTDAP